MVSEGTVGNRAAQHRAPELHPGNSSGKAQDLKPCRKGDEPRVLCTDRAGATALVRKVRSDPLSGETGSTGWGSVTKLDLCVTWVMTVATVRGLAGHYGMLGNMVYRRLNLRISKHISWKGSSSI